MTIEYICSRTAHLREKFGTADPEALCREENVTVLSEPMGTGADACKGFFLYQSRRKIIVINSDLDGTVQSFILAHELGHSILHAEAAVLRSFSDFFPYDETSRYEYEANIFAAELLLSDEDTLSALSEDDFFTAAKKLRVPPELLDFKLRILKHKGYDLNSPISANSCFLKDI